ncbi:MAG: hypothetical protein MUD12_04480 [Spirochaetes bacterium]|jgi:hypothetical protein|nr:hypothetical protein [Spirochaetota bacterium]
MKKKILAAAFLFLSAQACLAVPESIILGSWDYRIIMNGVEIGSARITNEKKDGNYVSIVDMDMRVGEVENSTRETITETAGFKPVRFELVNRVKNAGRETVMRTTAVFSGKDVEIDTDGIKTRIRIDRPFFLEGNYHMDWLIRKKFKKGAEIKSYIYDPSIELERPILMKLRVAGREKVSVGGKAMDLIRLIYTIENLKSIDVYIDSSGIARKSVIKMMNNELELVIK